jgi:hypothetical protein
MTRSILCASSHGAYSSTARKESSTIQQLAHATDRRSSCPALVPPPIIHLLPDYTRPTATGRYVGTHGAGSWLRVRLLPKPLNAGTSVVSRPAGLVYQIVLRLPFPIPIPLPTRRPPFYITFAFSRRCRVPNSRSTSPHSSA